MNDPKRRERLAEMHETIVMLRDQVRERKREANELSGGEDASNEAIYTLAAAQMLLDAERDKYIALAETILSRACPAHGPATLVSCPECVERNPELRPYHETFLAAVREMDEAAQ